jgi:MinD superfamily P-loop ATPase
MTKIITITGGKGGTGKSTVATSLSYELSKKYKTLLVDADVDCPNDHLLLNINRYQYRIINKRIPKIDNNLCLKCGSCSKVCKTKALINIKDKSPILISEQCNGCGACEIVCKNNAITWENEEIGKLFIGKINNLELLSGELNSNQPISEFIVNALNKEIQIMKTKYDFIIIDSAAGSHCPVIASFELADEIICVTEPTPLGHHDLEIIFKLLNKINKNSKVIVNKYDLGNFKETQDIVSKYNSDIILKIPYSKKIVDSYSNGNIIIIDNILKVIKE